MKNKRQLILIVLLFAAFTCRAQQKVGEFYNSCFKKNFYIESAEKDGKLQKIYIEVEAKRAKDASIVVSAENIESFKHSLCLVRDKYVEWRKVAVENNVTDVSKNFSVVFPRVSVAWLGSKWRFAFNQTVNMIFGILSDGSIVATWAPEVTASDNEYIDESIYFVFADASDFDNLIQWLDQDKIMEALMKTKKNEDLFN